MRATLGFIASILSIQLAVQPVEQVGKSVLRWESSTGIDVSDYSADRLRYEIPSLANQLRMDDPPPGMPADDYRAFVLDTLTQEYLFWSRDRAGQDTKRLGEPTVAPDALRAFLKQFQPAVTNRPVGRLDVTSDPPRGRIEIDGQDKGVTRNTFVMSVGQHTVIVRPLGRSECQEVVSIVAGRTHTMNC